MRYPLLSAVAFLILLTAAHLGLGARFPVGGLAAYAILALVPGLALHLVLTRRTDVWETTLWALAASPVIVVAIAAPAMLAGIETHTIALSLVVVVSAACLGVLVTRAHVDLTRPRSLLWLVLAIAGVSALIGYLPLSQEYWRYWADAWFHGAVVAEINDFGIPPQDPYFAGLDLQYMWLYHVYVLVMSKISGIDPMKVMPLINMQALAVLMLASYLLATHFRKPAAYGAFAVAVVILGVNAVAWAFLPLKLLRALTGHVRGWDEIARNYSLVPFDSQTVKQFLQTYYNPAFLLNKFIVSTAFSLGLGYMAVMWYTVTRYLEGEGRVPLVLALTALLGMIFFHTAVAFAAMGSLCGAMVLLLLSKRSTRGFSGGRFAGVATIVIGATVVCTPYLHSITRLKETEFLVPIAFSLPTSGAILVTSALVLVLAAFQLRRLAADRAIGARFLLYATISTFLVSNFVTFGGPNSNAKLPYFVFFLLAVIGSWTLAERYARRQARRSYRLRVLAVSMALLLPTNVLALAAFYNTTGTPHLDDAERAVAAWVSGHTPRDAVFFDTGERVFLLIAGPRRYYWGKARYAVQFGYPRAEMRRRRAVRDNLFADEPLQPATLRALVDVGADVYLVDRHEGARGKAPRNFAADPTLFSKVFAAGGIAVVRVDREECRTRVRGAPAAR